MDYICRMQPRGFVLENVTGIRNKKHRKHFNKLLRQLKECRLPGSQKRAYAVSWRMVNSPSFGLPQNRKRIYIMGARRSTRKGGHQEALQNQAEQHFGRKEEAQGEGCLESGQGHHRRRSREKLPAGHLGLCSHSHMRTSLRRQLLARQQFLPKPDLASANNQVWRVAQPAARLQPVLRKVAFSASRSWRFHNFRWPKSVSRAKRGKMVGNAMSVPVLREAMRAVLTAARLIRWA